MSSFCCLFLSIKGTAASNNFFMSAGTQVQKISHYLHLKMEVFGCKLYECLTLLHWTKLFSKYLYQPYMKVPYPISL